MEFLFVDAFICFPLLSYLQTWPLAILSGALRHRYAPCSRYLLLRRDILQSTLLKYRLVQISAAKEYSRVPVFYSKSTDILCKEMQYLIRLRECFPLQMYKVHTNKKTDVQNNDLWLHNREGLQSFTCCGLRLLGLDGR